MAFLAPVTPVEATFEEFITMNEIVAFGTVTPSEATFEEMPADVSQCLIWLQLLQFRQILKMSFLTLPLIMEFWHQPLLPLPISNRLIKPNKFSVFQLSRPMGGFFMASLNCQNFLDFYDPCLLHLQSYVKLQ